MSDFNKTFIIGNLVQDPQLKEISSTNKVVNFTIAVNRSWAGSQGEEAKEVSYIDCTAYGKKAEVIDKYFSKGRKIFVDGRLKQEKWVDKDTQKTQSRIRVVVENFHFMDSKKESPDVCATVTDTIPASAGNTNTTIEDDFDVM